MLDRYLRGATSAPASPSRRASSADSATATRLGAFMIAHPHLLIDGLYEQRDRLDAIHRAYGRLCAADASGTAGASASAEMRCEVEADLRLLREALIELDASVRSAPARDASAPPLLSPDPPELEVDPAASRVLAAAISRVELTDCGRWNRLSHLAEASGLGEMARAFFETARRCVRRHQRLEHRASLA